MKVELLTGMVSGDGEGLTTSNEKGDIVEVSARDGERMLKGRVAKVVEEAEKPSRK
jgi:hypothetical protein